MRKHNFKEGDGVYFRDTRNLCVFGEVIATYGPWLWVDDGGGLYTVYCDDASYDSDNVPGNQEASW